VEKNIKIGPPWLTKYERTRIIGARALQLSLGAPPLLPKEKLKGMNELEIAETELESGVLPILIYRRKPNGETQVLSLSELNKPV